MADNAYDTLDSALKKLAPNSYGAMQNQSANVAKNIALGNYATAAGNSIGNAAAGAALPFEYLAGSARHIGGIAANGVGNFFRGVAGYGPSQNQTSQGMAAAAAPQLAAQPVQQSAMAGTPTADPQLAINAKIEANRQAASDFRAQPAQAPTGGGNGLGSFANGKQIPLVSRPTQSSLSPEQQAQSISNSQADLNRLTENANIRSLMEMPNDRIGPAQQAYIQGVLANRGHQINADASLAGHRIGAQSQMDVAKLNSATSASNNAATNQAGMLKQMMEDQRARELKQMEIDADKSLKDAQTKNYLAQAAGETRVAKTKQLDGSEVNQFYSSRENPATLNGLAKQQSMDPNYAIIHNAAIGGNAKALAHVNQLAASGDQNAQATLSAIQQLSLAGGK